MSQKIRPRFSIRYKFLLVMTLLLAFCVSVYLWVASHTFKEDKKNLVFDLNGNMVTTLAAELEANFRSYSDKMTLFALLHNKSGDVKTIMDEIIRHEPDIVFMSLNLSGKTVVRTFLNSAFLSTYGIFEDFFTSELILKRPIPLDQILQAGEHIWNATIPHGPPLIGFGKSVVEEDVHQKPVRRWSVIAYIHTERLMKSLPSNKLYSSYIINRDGELLVHQNSQLMSHPKAAQKWLATQKALTMPTKTLVTEYHQGPEEFLGAFSKVYGGRLLVVAEASGRKAFSAIDGLWVRSLMFGSLILTLAFLAALLLSRSLTRPLQTLVLGMSKVSHGDLNTQIQIQSQDEISVLANTFNTMIRDLKISRLKLEEMNRDLEQKVLDRTRQLAEQNRAIKEAQEALLKTSRLAAIGEIAGHAAHEVLNPLTSLLARTRRVQDRLGAHNPELKLLSDIQKSWEKDYARGGFEGLVQTWHASSTIDPQKSLWQEDMENLKSVVHNWKMQNEELRKDTEFIITEAHRIEKIVSGMRSLSVVRAELKPWSAHQLLRESISIMADLYEQAKVQITLMAEATDDLVLVDKDEFIQALTNLLRNSLQAIESIQKPSYQGWVRIVTANNGNDLVIRICDNGPGISIENQTKLFQIQFSTKSADAGTGLGLGISRRFIRAFGGDLEFESSHPSLQTIFRIRIPLSNPQEAAS